MSKPPPDCPRCQDNSGWITLPPTPRYPHGAATQCECRRIASIRSRCSGLPTRISRDLDNINLDNVDNVPRAGRWAEAWPEFDRGLFLFGGYGVGKTYATAAIVKAIGHNCPFKDIPKVGWVNTKQFIRALKASWTASNPADQEAAVWAKLRAQLIVLDDLSLPASAWQKETLALLVEYLYDAGTPCLISANEPPQVLWRALGGAVESRLHEMVVPVAVTGSDRRQPEAE